MTADGSQTYDGAVDRMTGARRRLENIGVCEMAKEEIGVIASIILIVAVLFCPLIDRSSASRDLVGTGVVIDKLYTPESSSSGTGMAFGGKGGVTPVMTHSHTSEKWILLVEFEGETFSKNCTPAVWAKYSKGQRCEVVQLNGKLFSYGREVQ